MQLSTIVTARRYQGTPVAAIYAGTNEIMKTIIAKNMGSTYKENRYYTDNNKRL